MNRTALAFIALLISGCAGKSRAPVFPERHYESEMSAGDAFARYLADFQRDPRDDKARSQVIDLAGKVDPRPTRPPQVEILAGKAVAAIKNAKSPADFSDAAAAFEQASRLAPWVGSFYNNAAVAYEKAGRPDEAVKHYAWYLQAAPADPDAPRIRRHMGELQYEADKRAKFQAQLASLEGYEWVFSSGFGGGAVMVVKKGKLIYQQKGVAWGDIPPSFEIDVDPAILARTWPGSASYKLKFSADFLSITGTLVDTEGNAHTLLFMRD
jgi:tetratricopeptide (TPR) repeat protein